MMRVSYEVAGLWSKVISVWCIIVPTEIVSVGPVVIRPVEIAVRTIVATAIPIRTVIEMGSIVWAVPVRSVMSAMHWDDVGLRCVPFDATCSTKQSAGFHWADGNQSHKQ